MPLFGETFYTLNEAKIVTEGWRRHYDVVRQRLARLPSFGATRLPSFGAKGHRARARGVAGSANPTDSAAHAPTITEANHELTFNLEHSVATDQ